MGGIIYGLTRISFSAAADIAKETITETMNQNETEKFIKIMMERDAQNAEANENSIKTGSRMKEATILRLKRILSFMMPLMF